MANATKVKHYTCSCLNCYLLDITFVQCKKQLTGTNFQKIAWRRVFDIFCCDLDSDTTQILFEQFNTRDLQEKFHIALIDQFSRGFLISQEYLFLYMHKIIENNVPISANVFGDDRYLRFDEKEENYMHPSDVFSVNIPKFWKELFFNEYYFYDSRFISNFIEPKVCNSLQRDPANMIDTTLKTIYGLALIDLVQRNEGKDKLPP